MHKASIEASARGSHFCSQRTITQLSSHSFFWCYACLASLRRPSCQVIKIMYLFATFEVGGRVGVATHCVSTADIREEGREAASICRAEELFRGVPLNVPIMPSILQAVAFQKWNHCSGTLAQMRHDVLGLILRDCRVFACFFLFISHPGHSVLARLVRNVSGFIKAPILHLAYYLEGFKMRRKKFLFKVEVYRNGRSAMP